MDLNGDGRIGGGYGHAPPQHHYNQYGGAGYAPPPPQYGAPYGGAPCPPNYGGAYGYPQNYGMAPPPPQGQYPPYGGAPAYGYPPAHHGGGGGGLLNQLEKATGMDLNGDGRIGGGAGYPRPPYGHHY